ncbi:hypothetical protein [Nocardia anaemiae]|uniref:hypothetical protein n=1 Tax=Nocardia anaemiae TaxID=263910 RepID=UPI000A8919AA|nr:hypothetical protein [Nocardia anaemiae]
MRKSRIKRGIASIGDAQDLPIRLSVERGIIGTVRDTALTCQYSKNAGADRRAANVWRLFTVFALFGVIIAAGWIVWIVSTDRDPNWHTLAAKTVFTASLSGFAIYASRQSSEHRRAQRHAEEMAAQLAALKPYLGDIEDAAKRDQLSADVALRLFGHSATQNPLKKTKNKGRTDSIILLKQAMTLIGQLSKNVRP